MPHGLYRQIPVELAHLANLKRLDFSVNELTGALPSELAHLASLQSLDPAVNRLSGPIPPEVGSLSRLARLELWQDDRTGGGPGGDPEEACSGIVAPARGSEASSGLWLPSRSASYDPSSTSVSEASRYPAPWPTSAPTVV